MKTPLALLLSLVLATSVVAQVDSSRDMASAHNLKAAVGDAFAAKRITAGIADIKKSKIIEHRADLLSIISDAGDRSSPNQPIAIIMLARNSEAPLKLIAEARGLLKDIPATAQSRTFEQRYLIPAEAAIFDIRDNPRTYKQSSVDALRYLAEQLRQARK